KEKLRHSLGRPSRSDFVQFKFVDNEHLPDGEYIALIRGNMDSRNTIEYKKIEDNVLVIRKEG
ncbi:hypothetical protein, partial [Agathobacter rectalis]